MYNYFFFLNDMATLLPLILKKVEYDASPWVCGPNVGKQVGGSKLKLSTKNITSLAGSSPNL
jgi:hypothetical protein